MRSLLVAVLLAGCSNACPPPVACYESHPDYCPCRLADGGFDTGIAPSDDANDQSDAFVDMTDAGALDTGSIDAASVDTGGNG